ncbi:MAG: hypothetical protein J6A46_05430, partial [Clostridia bacterium]|nr:hypothetical protein [Clostridia bacterium]
MESFPRHSERSRRISYPNPSRNFLPQAKNITFTNGKYITKPQVLYHFLAEKISLRSQYHREATFTASPPCHSGTECNG